MAKVLHLGGILVKVLHLCLGLGRSSTCSKGQCSSTVPVSLCSQAILANEMYSHRMVMLSGRLPCWA